MQPVDLTDWPFWTTLAAGVVVGNAVLLPTARKWALAAVNLGFVAVLVGGYAPLLALACVLISLVLREGSDQRLGEAVRAVAAIGFMLFVVNKAGQAGWLPHDLSLAQQILSAVGFSYIAVRWLDLFRSVQSGGSKAPDIAETINYLVPFHMLAAGPMQTYDDFRSQSAIPARLTLHEALGGVERITQGLFKKFVLAAIIQSVFLTGFRAEGWYFLLEVQLFFIWLYLDFSAYSDIACGIGRLMGVPTPENFNRPYLSRNLIEFWERWHITLSQMVRKHLFFPVQLSLMRGPLTQHPQIAAAVAFFVAFAICGLWHQATLGYLVWGLTHAFGLTVATSYRLFLKRSLGPDRFRRYLEDTRVLWCARLITFQYVAFSLVAVVRT